MLYKLIFPCLTTISRFAGSTEEGERALLLKRVSHDFTIFIIHTVTVSKANEPNPTAKPNGTRYSTPNQKFVHIRTTH